MAVSPQILARIADPTSGRLESIGKNYLKAKQVGIENARNAEADKMIKDKFQQEQAIVGAKVTGAYAKDALKFYEDNPDAPAEQARDYQLELMGQYEPAYQSFIPEALQSKEQLQRGLEISDKILRAFEPENYKVDESDLNKWETELSMIQAKNDNPDAWTTTKQEQLEALQRQQLLPVSMGRPSKTEDIFSKQSLEVLKKGDDTLKGNIENEKAYIQDLASEKRKLMEERELLVRQKKENNLLSDAEATQLAHGVLKERLQVSDILFEKTGYANPFGKKYIYTPEKKETKPEQPEKIGGKGLSESEMVSVLKNNNMEDTPDNRTILIEQYAKR